MVWFALSDDQIERVLLAGLSRSTALTLVELGSWSARLLTDGALPRTMVRSASTSPDLEADLEVLVAARFLEITDTGWCWPRWEDSQRTRAQVEADRAKNKVRQQRYRDNRSGAMERRKAAHAAADHRWCFPETCSEARNAVTHASSNDSTNGHPLPLLSPTPDNGGVGGGGEAEGRLSTAVRGGSAGATPRDAAPRAHRANGDTLVDDALVEELRRAQMMLATGFYDVRQADTESDDRALDDEDQAHGCEASQ